MKATAPPQATAAAAPNGGTGHPAQQLAGLMLALAAVAVPYLLAGSVPPTATFFNQLWSFGAWGVVVAVWAVHASRAAPAPGTADQVSAQAGLSARPLWAVLAALGLLLLAHAASPVPKGMLAAPMVGLVLCGAVLALAWLSARSRAWPQALPVLLMAMLAAGLLSAGVALVQVFAPQWADGNLVAAATTPGRAVGNVRQPNQLSTILLWACGAAVYLALQGRWPQRVLAALLALLVFATCLTASRTGLVGVLLLGLWGLVDRRLPRRTRALLLASLPFYALAWWAMTQWSVATGHAFLGTSRMEHTLHGDASSSRFDIWRDTLHMIAAHPWAGVGFGRFNFVWTFTPFPHRPVAFFDHSHNLELELAAEGGLPLALAVLGLIGWALWAARGALVAADDARAQGARTALFMLAVVGLHSQLEYPLWYAYFLLPSAAWLGWYLGGGAAGGDDAAASAPAGAASRTALPMHLRLGLALLAALGAMTLAGCVVALREYRQVAVIFEPALDGRNAAPLEQRIERGRNTALFAQHADYALVTLAERPSTVFDGFLRPLHHLIDTRLMIAYARALAERGELDQAAHVAARLREFRNPAAAEFLAECEVERDPMPAHCRSDPKLRADQLSLR